RLARPSRHHPRRRHPRRLHPRHRTHPGRTAARLRVRPPAKVRQRARAGGVMYDELIGTWLVWVGIGWFIIAGVAYLTRPAQGDDPVRREYLDDLARAEREWGRACECEDGQCIACTIDRHPAGKGLRGEEL